MDNVHVQWNCGATVMCKIMAKIKTPPKKGGQTNCRRLIKYKFIALWQFTKTVANSGADKLTIGQLHRFHCTILQQIPP
jgi:hypothetical protein